MARQVGSLNPYLPQDILDKYEVYNYRNAAQLLATSATAELSELVDALRTFSLTLADIRKPGGSESDIPKRLSGLLRPNGWQEMRITGDLVISKLAGKRLIEVEGDTTDDLEKAAKKTDAHIEKSVIKNFLDGHRIDFVKGRVAFDVEWNSKDQTFDRDLYAFRAFYECDLIDAGVILTRSADLNEVFDKLGAELDATGKPRIDPKTNKPKLLKTKYGASTTWMGKLLYRLDAGRQGGCPVLGIGITRRLITDWTE